MNKQMKYIVRSEFGKKRFYKIGPLRDFLWQFFPKYLHKLEVYKKNNDGILEKGQFINDKRVVRF